MGTTTKLATGRRPLLGTVTRSLGATGLLLGTWGMAVPAATAATVATAHAKSAEHSKKSSHPKSHHRKSRGASASGGSRPGSVAAAQAEALRFAECMRSHGVANFPDNAITVTPQGDFRIDMSGGSGVDPNSPQFQSAVQSCRKDLPHAAAGAGPSAGSVNRLLKYAQCMRNHGVAGFPEPNSSGQIRVIFGKGPNAPTGSINPGTPQYQAAAKACRSLQPAGMP